MADTIEINGKEYIEIGYLIAANKTAKRRGDKIKRLENLNQTALYWLLGIEKSIASDDHGHLLCYFEADEVERLHAFIEVMRDKA